MNQQTSFRDDDPAAPWMLDKKLGGMTPPSRRKSWEASQARARQVLDFGIVNDFPATRTNGHPLTEDEPIDDDAPPPSDPQDYRLAAEVSDVTPRIEAKIIARPYVFCDPSTIPRRDRLYGNHLFRGFTSAIVAPGGMGKTSLIVAQALAMVTQRRLLKMRVAGRPLRVWLWNLEDPFEELQRRIQAACLHHQIGPEDIGDRLHVNGREDGLVIARQTASGAIVAEPVVEALIAEIAARQIDVFVVDPFVSSHAVAENDNSAIDAVVKAWNRVAGGGNCAIELVHHARKLGDNEVTAESSRGAIAMVAACRDVQVLNRMTKEEGERYAVDNHRLYFRCHSDKANLAPPSDVSDWYRLVSVDLCNGPPGESDQVQAVTRWDLPDALDGLTARDLFAVQKAIAAGEWREDSQAKNWAGVAVAQVLNFDLKSAPPLARVKTLLKTWLANGALKATRRPDEHRKKRTFFEVGKWATP